MIFRIILAFLVCFPAIANAMNDQVFQDMIHKINSGDLGSVEKFLETNLESSIKM